MSPPLIIIDIDKFIYVRRKAVNNSFTTYVLKHD